MNYDVNLSAGWAILLALAVIWDLVWRGVGLWRAAQNKDTVWFVAMIVINSIGILPIIYMLLHKNETS